jgi:two-component system nitrate/nitrite response regulator NarL
MIATITPRNIPQHTLPMLPLASRAQMPSSALRPVVATVAQPQPAKTKRVRILIADDHPVVRRGLGSMLASQEQFEIVGEAGDGHQTLERARTLLPDVILMDIDMPQMSGLAVTELLRQQLPQIKVLILSMHSNPEFVVRILQSGARGYALKDTSPDELVRAITTIHAGDAFFSPDVARLALDQFVRGNTSGPNPSDLTNREREVLIQIAEGRSNKEIANILNVGVRTIETHRERIMKKLDIHSIAGLTRFAVSNGLVTLPEKMRTP